MGSNLAQDFIMGVDPFGVYTSQYGQQAEQAGLSEGQHRTKQLVSAAGGVAGGGALLPSLVMGTVTGSQKALSAGKGRRLAEFGKGFVEGVKRPLSGARDVYRARSAIRRARSGQTTLTAAEAASFKNLMSEVRVKDLLRGAAASAVSGSNKSRRARARDAVRGALDTRKLLSKNILTKDLASTLKNPLTRGGMMLSIPLVAGAGFGGGGAAAQYSKGRESERKFKRRSGGHMYKMSSVERAAAHASFYLELEKISSPTIFKILKSGPTGIARSAGRAVRKVKDSVTGVTGYPSKLYGAYSEGFHQRSLADRLKAIGDDIGNIDPATLAVPALVGSAGVATGAALGLASRKRNNRNNRNQGY